MMNDKKNWKMTLVFGLLVSLILPTASLANAKTNALPSPPKLAGGGGVVLVKYGQLAAKYLVDCDDLGNQARPSGEKLKRCLTIAKELRDRFTEFIETSDTLVRNLKNAKKWTKELDEQFNNEASKKGVDAETLGDVRQAGGLRAFYQKNIAELKGSKNIIDAEIKELETQTKENAATQNQIFQKVSYAPNANARFLGALKKIAKVAYKVAVAIIAACELSGGFCD